MQKKIIGLIVFVIILLMIVIISNINIETELIPEVEIEEKDLRKTMVSLYFFNTQKNELEKETRFIDAKELVKNPYNKTLEMLFSGPQKEQLSRIIPNGTKIVKTHLENGVLDVYLTSEFFEGFENEESKNIAIKSISDTLTEYKEVDSVNILSSENIE